MNELGAKGQAFVFVIDFNFEKPLIFEPDDTSSILWRTPRISNFEPIQATSKEIDWKIYPSVFAAYSKAFDQVQKHIHNGDTYLLNLTMPTQVKTNLSPEDIFHRSNASYKIWLKDQFICFSPE